MKLLSHLPLRHPGFWLAQLLGLLLLLLSFVIIAGNLQSSEFGGQVLDAVFSGPIWGTRLARNLAWFALSLALLHGLYAAGCWVVGRLSAHAWPQVKATVRQHVVLWFLAITVGLLANNAAAFPRSSLGFPYAEPMGHLWWGIPVGRWLLMLVLAGATVTVVRALIHWWTNGRRLTRRAWTTAGLVAAMGVAVSAYSIFPQSRAAASDRPNVILIGIDSLRADLLDPATSPGATPHVDAFMKQGVRFTDAITPLARTFPSMMSMLTGRRPHRTGAVMNLLPRDQVRDDDSLPRILERNGYRTAYATDEVRFSNIDASYGFGQAITPPIGASEFLIAKLADTPLSNLVIRTAAIKWFFPHLYGNRGAATTYDPDRFVYRLDDELRPTAPMFITIHLTLAHWPYTWADSPPMARDPDDRWPDYYLHAARRVDQQFQDVLDVLQRKGLLENAIVVAYSDHGESFESPNEALVPDGDPLIEALHLKPTWGHGTTVLTAHQFRIVLGMRRYGGNDTHWPIGVSQHSPVSFEDIAPTVVDALAVKTAAPFDGRSLLPLVEQRAGAAESFQGRIRFTETEFVDSDLATVDGKVSPSALWQAFLMYRIDPETDHIEVKRSRLPSLLIDRQYAAIGPTQLLATVPRKPEGGQDFLTVPLAGGVPREIPDAPPAAEDAELRALWTAMNTEFGDVIDARRQHVAAAAVANRLRTIPQDVTK